MPGASVNLTDTRLGLLSFAAGLLLFAIVVISWVLRRGEISNRTAVRYLVFGLLYPFLAFAFTEVMAAPLVG